MSNDQNKNLDQLSEILLNTKSKKEMKEFLLGILTPVELEEIPMRLQIVKLLKKGYAQHQVAEKLGVGVATVTRGAREIRLGRFKNVY